MNGLDTDALTALMAKANSADPQLAMMFTMLTRLDDNITKLADRIENQNEARRIREGEQDAKIAAHEVRIHNLETGTREDRDDSFKRAGVIIAVVSALLSVGSLVISLIHH